MAEDEDENKSAASIYLQELRRQDAVLGSLQRMFSCEKRGLCLLREWTRRYGNPGNGCACSSRFTEHVVDSDY